MGLRLSGSASVQEAQATLNPFTGGNLKMWVTWSHLHNSRQYNEGECLILGQKISF